MMYSNRLQGLDVLRALAITLVFLSHYEFITGYNPFGMMSQFGGIGVDLFFVLSGYLIGNQIFYSLHMKQNFNIKNFYIRRFFRIIPAFYFMLLIYFSVPFQIEQPLNIPLWKFVTFTMNINAQAFGAFSNSWSLCVEEHFYILFPILATVILKMRKPLIFLYFLALAFTCTILLRYILFTNFVNNTTHYDINYLRYIYFPTFCRLDGLILGVAAAFFKNFYEHLWVKITKFRYSNCLLILGLCGLFLARGLFQAKSLAITSATFGYTLSSISCFILLLSAVNPQSLINKYYIPGASLLAAWSYSIYLTQKIAIYLVFQFFAMHYKTYNEGYLCVLAVTVCTLLLGWSLYRFIELPLLKLRDQKVRTLTWSRGSA